MYSTVAATKAHIVLDPFDISATGIQISSERERAKGKDGSGAAAYHRISHVLSPEETGPTSWSRFLLPPAMFHDRADD